jgi:hypothetical protein
MLMRAPPPRRPVSAIDTADRPLEDLIDAHLLQQPAPGR